MIRDCENNKAMQKPTTKLSENPVSDPIAVSKVALRSLSPWSITASATSHGPGKRKGGIEKTSTNAYHENKNKAKKKTGGTICEEILRIFIGSLVPVYWKCNVLFQ